MPEPDSTLSALLPTMPTLLAYTIPLLIVTVPLTFAGTFLTLDRSRSFASSYTSVPLPSAFDGLKKLSKIKFPLQGGVGGLASGYVFGVHLSTFLSLLVPAVSSSVALSTNSFLAVWILSCLLTTILGGRYKYCARIFAALSGGSLLALSISVVIHPPLLPRQILTGLFASLSLLAALLFSLPALSRFLRPTLRILTASSGAFSLVLSIALLTHIPAWADIWERLWLGDSESWGTSKEKGLSTAYFILLGAGILTDHVLNKWLGECPDEEWDHFLANYSAELPNDSDRAGIFRPLPLNSLWGRLLDFLASKEKKEEIYPMSPPWKKYSENKISKYPTLSDDEYDKDFAKPSQNHLSDDFPASPAFLKAAQYQKIKLKPRKRARGFKITQGRKQSVKFDQDLSSDSSDGDSEELQHRKDRPWLKKMASINSSSPTLVDHTVLPVYSDYEEDISTPKSKYSITEGGTGWRPEFMKRHSSSAESGATGGKFLSAASHSSAPMGAVPATPSLIKALDRISAAQRDAFASTRVLPSNVLSSDSSAKKIAANADDLPRLQEVEYNYSYNPPDANAKRKGQLAPMWEEFWREVKHKAMT